MAIGWDQATGHSSQWNLTTSRCRDDPFAKTGPGACHGMPAELMPAGLCLFATIKLLG
jgi:hypothetical protein